MGLCLWKITPPPLLFDEFSWPEKLIMQNNAIVSFEHFETQESLKLVFIADECWIWSVRIGLNS